MSKVEGWHYLVGPRGEKLAHHCSKCGCDSIIGNGCAPRVFHCNQWEEYKPEEPSGFFATLFSSPAPLPRIQFRETPVRCLIQRDESE